MRNKILIVLVVIVALFYSCKKEYTKDGTTKIVNYKNVGVQHVERLLNVQPITATGTLLSKEEIVLSFKISGIVANLRVEEGETIEKGQRLGSLDLTEINAQVVGAQKNYNKSVRDLERATNLYRDTVGTLEQQQNAKTTSEIARSNLQIARFNQQHAVLGAPITARVLKRLVEEGELVSAGQPVYIIGSSHTNGSQIVRLGLSDKDIIRVGLGDKALIGFDAFVNKEFEAKVTEIAGSANPKTGLFEVELTIGNFIPELKNGFIGKVAIYPSSKFPSLKIPMNALVEGNERKASIYFTQDEKTLTNVEVEVLEIKGDYFTIAVSELPEDAKVITRGAPYLKNNDSINIIQ
ncbi:efflux RND transporter periplasmic adaptor subunit [Croceitalea sp. MTPC5]|uniref:efflux RND transporter periplasmic adaptor subunit n=1 Tax=Croceitalea sp. MTPC5 TaxID=3056565 RepID=UPI002B3DF9DF|nr:efflux RND transporter periplasmic adaptor subunit [Croceitalea sp. MTPC5]